MKKVKWLGSILLMCILSVISSQAQNLKPELFECSDNQCDWVIIKDKKLIKQEGTASLYNVGLIWGHSLHRKGHYPKGYSKKIDIDWVSSSKDEFSLFCYSKLPVYIVGNEFNILNFKYADTRAVKTAAMEYVRICYDAPWNSSLSESFQKKHNLSEPFMDEVSVKKPEELFQYVK